MEGKIYIIGFIGNQEDDFSGIELVDVISQVRNQPEATSFKCYIDSPGGVVETGDAIYNYLKSLPVPLTTVGSNMVASIATVIFMAGSTRIINEGCEFMIHLPMGGINYATADEMEAQARIVRETENRMIKFYCNATGLEKEAITPLLKNETWLTAEQLKSFGFITGDSPLKITARARFINKKPKKQKMAKGAKKKTARAKMQAFFDLFDLAGDETTNVVLKSADQTDVDFYDLDEGTDISVGDRARIDGVDAEGEITMADGRVVTFEAGAVTDIQDAPEGDEDMEAELAEALAKVETLTGEKKALETEVTGLKKEIKTKNKIVANIRALESKLGDDGDERKAAGGRKRKETAKASKAATALANMKKIKNAKNTAK